MLNLQLYPYTFFEVNIFTNQDINNDRNYSFIVFDYIIGTNFEFITRNNFLGVSIFIS